MIRLTTALLTLGIIIATASTVTAQGQGDECFWVGCNPEAGVCRLLCGSDDPRQTEIGERQAPYASAYPQHQYHRHAKHHHKTAHYSG